MHSNVTAAFWGTSFHRRRNVAVGARKTLQVSSKDTCSCTATAADVIEEAQRPPLPTLALRGVSSQGPLQLALAAALTMVTKLKLRKNSI